MAEKGNFDFIYNPIKEKMQELVSHISYTTYIEKLTPVDIDGRYIVLETPTESFAKYITNTLAEKMREAIIKADVGLSDFRLRVEGSEGFAYNSPDEDDEIAAPANIDKRYTFDSYVVCKNNEIVHAAALAVANEPAGIYNPLFIYGGTGLGKTHLLQAIANKILADKPNLKVIYVTCEQFVNEIIDTMFTSRGPDARDRGSKLRHHYRSADVLIIDDIQFIANKKAVQEEFFHTFNELISKGKQIVISSDRHPKELEALEDRLRTRFQAGLTYDVLPPTYEDKIAILKRKAFEKKCLVPEEVLEFLAQDSGDDVRTLEGRLSKVIFAAKLHEVAITADLAERAVGGRFGGQRRDNARQHHLRRGGILQNFQSRPYGQEQKERDSYTEADLLLSYVRFAVPPLNFHRKDTRRARPHDHYPLPRQDRRNDEGQR